MPHTVHLLALSSIVVTLQVVVTLRQATRNRHDGLALTQLRIAQQELDAAIVEAVKDGRAGGQSWAMIGAQLGVTKQAAQQRYGRHPITGGEKQDQVLQE